jgi:hypothetical protein
MDDYKRREEGQKFGMAAKQALDDLHERNIITTAPTFWDEYKKLTKKFYHTNTEIENELPQQKTQPKQDFSGVNVLSADYSETKRPTKQD